MNTGHGSRSPSRETLPFAAAVYRGDDGEDEPSAVDALRVELRNEVRALRGFIARSASKDDLGRELAAIRAALDDLAPAPRRGDGIATLLRARGVEGAAATRLAALARRSPATTLAGQLADALRDTIPLAPFAHAVDGRRIVALVGSSGVGKTTTAAKIAAHARMSGKSVAFVGCDGYRVGALEQLERYGELLGAAVHVARTSSELAAVLEAEESDLVVVDTSGRPPSASAPEWALAARRKEGAPVPVEVILCMPAAVRAADAARIAATFAVLAPTSVCVTKVDETAAPAGLVHAPWAAKRPLALLCSGPRVPEDVTSATPSAVVAAFGAAETGEEGAK